MNNDLGFKIFAGVIIAVVIAFACLLLFKPRPKWTSDLTHATCEQLRAGVSYTCVQDGVVYVCVDDWDAHHRSCAKLPAVSQ